MHRFSKCLNKRAMRATRAAATTELALIMPLLLLFLLGAIDVGYYANTYQVVSNASREGARVAAKSNVSDVATIETAVRDYVGNALPNMTAESLSNIIQVDVVNPATGGSYNSGLSTLAEGSAVRVDVEMPYSAVQITPGFDLLGSRSVGSSTVMRRQ